MGRLTWTGLDAQTGGDEPAAPPISVDRSRDAVMGRRFSAAKLPRGRSAWAAALVVAVALLPVHPAASQESDPWQQFLADRPALYEQLAPPFVDCFKRRDSAIDPLSPIFHGCIDWHSAAHAAYSHHALYRHTGAREYLDLAEQQIAPNGVSLIPAEYAYEQAKAPNYPLTENPYGFGWFLILARERELSTGKTDFREMADFAAGELMSWFQTRLATGDARSFILNNAHPNYSWSLINLDVWARHTNDETIRAVVRDATRPLFDATLDTSCPATSDTNPNASGFQPRCLMRLAAAAHVWGDHVRDWVLARLPAGLHVPPVTAPANCHAGGLNFSRSFALYQLYLVTGDTRYRDNYVELIRYHVGRPDLYIDPSYLGSPGYLCYSHWVAQFGVRSISQSYEERPATPAASLPSATTGVSIASTGVAGSTLTVAGASTYADQPFAQLGTDPTGDSDLPGTNGQDLVSAAAAGTHGGTLRLRFAVASLPSGTGRGVRVNYGWAFCLSGSGSPACYEIDAWSTGLTNPAPEVEVWRCADPACRPDGQTPTGITAIVAFDGAARTATVGVALAALGGAPGSILTPSIPVDAPVFTGVGVRHSGGDRLGYEGAYRTAVREVSLAVGPSGQDPATVSYSTAADVGRDGGYSGAVDVSGLPPGIHTIYARACFGANNCAYATRNVAL